MKVQTQYYDIQLGNKTVQVRKWKGKDRNDFKEVISKGDNISKGVIRTLVTNCLKVPVALSPNEIEYLFIKIRELSISDTFKITYICEKCKEKQTQELKINDVITYTKEGFKTVNVGDIKIEFSEPSNIEFYNKEVIKAPLNELALHIKSINDSFDFTYIELKEYLEDLDVSTLDKIVEEFIKQKFNIHKVYELQCLNQKCNFKEKYFFDEIPDFFPPNWLQ